MTPPGEDARLIAATRRGNQDAFRELYEMHVGAVRAVAKSILRTGDVDDLCQEIFLLAFTRLNSFEETAAFRTWITRIAINQCLQALRRRKQESNGDACIQPLEEDGFPERSWFGAEDRELRALPARLDLAKALRILPVQQRLVLEMAYLEGIPDLEIAEMLGTSLTCVKSKLNRAKRQARNFLDRGEAF